MLNLEAVDDNDGIIKALTWEEIIELAERSTKAAGESTGCRYLIIIEKIIPFFLLMLCCVSKLQASAMPVDGASQQASAMPADSASQQASAMPADSASQQASAMPVDGASQQGSAVSVEGLSDLKKNIRKELKGQSGKWSVYVKNLETNEYLIINNRKLPSASLIKLFVMLASYDEAADKGGIKEDRSFKRYMKKMITVSDNESANELTKKLSKKGTFSAGAAKINQYCKANGYVSTKFLVEMGKSSPKNVTSAEDCGMALESMYRGTAVSKKSSKKMIKLLKGQTRRGKIPAGLPKGVTVANKTGETTFAENDAAIVYSAGADYVIVVMSKNGHDSVTEIQKISKMVYNYFN